METETRVDMVIVEDKLKKKSMVCAKTVAVENKIKTK